MIIGFDGSRAFVEERTGTENYSYQLLLNLSKIDIENRYLIYLRPGQLELIQKDEWPNNFEFKVLNYQRLWTQIGLSGATFVDPLDLLFVSSHTLPTIVRPGLKTILTVHDLGAEYLPTSHQLKQRLYLGFMTYYQLKQASHLIAVSEATKKDIIKKVGIPEQKITVIYEGVNELTEGKNKKSPNNIYGDKNDTKRGLLDDFGLSKKKYFLFVGTIQPRKNLIRLIQSFSNFNKTYSKDYKLLLVGGKGWLSDEIYQEPARLGIENKVIFTGRLSDSEVRTLYENAAALTFVSLFEGFGLPLLEAFKYKCPVITSDVSSMPEVVSDAAILVNPHKIDEITQAMIDVVKNDKLRYILIHKGNNRIQYFSWKKCAKETLELFNKLKI